MTALLSHYERIHRRLRCFKKIIHFKVTTHANTSNILDPFLAPIYARVTVNGNRIEISTHRKVSPLEWNTEAQMLISKSQEAKEINNHLAIMKAKLLSCQSKLESRGRDITAETIKNEYVGNVLKGKK